MKPRIAYIEDEELIAMDSMDEIKSEHAGEIEVLYGRDYAEFAKFFADAPQEFGYIFSDFRYPGKDPAYKYGFIDTYRDACVHGLGDKVYVITNEISETIHQAIRAAGLPDLDESHIFKKPTSLAAVLKALEILPTRPLAPAAADIEVAALTPAQDSPLLGALFPQP